ncbi:MAG: nucleotide exchange factor GrpE [Ruminococcaceae bacterium]|nr:nucleotide exchange factor GrpE [Oscillospiraceae bacterium]
MAEEKTQIPADEETAAKVEDVTEQNADETEGEKGKVKSDKKTKKLEAKIAELEKSVADKDAEIAAGNDKYMRMAAEYDNFRKRSAKEKEGIYSDAYADALKSILPIIDNLERAVGATGAEAVAKGLEMTLKGASEALTKMGVEAFGAEGDAFDPNMHNAMMMVDDENHKEGEIVTVFQKGYKKGDKIIRYAMVTVAN